MNVHHLRNAECDDSSRENDRAVHDPASFRIYEDKNVWKPEVSLSEKNKFASLFFLFNDFEFNDCKPTAVIVAQAKHCSSKCDVERIRCFEAIQFICKKGACPEFLHTCCRILDAFTNLKSDSLIDYMRHNRWAKFSTIQPLEVFKETIVLDLIDNFDLLIRNRQIVLQDWASRMLCRFLVYFYNCMLLYMYLLKEQEKEARSKRLKLVLDQRRKGLKTSLETSIENLFDPNCSISVKTDIVEGGQDFMVCIRADEETHFKKYLEQSLTSYFFCFWSRTTSFKRLSIIIITHSLMKFLQKYCKKWSFRILRSKVTARVWMRMCNVLSVCSQQDRVVNDHVKEMQQGVRASAFQKWKQLNTLSKNAAQVFSRIVCKKVARIFMHWTQMTRMQIQFFKIILRNMAHVFMHWSQITKMQKGLNKNRNMLKYRFFKSWKIMLTSTKARQQTLSEWSGQFFSKQNVNSQKARFEVWKRWYLARWIARSYINKKRATRALNAWIEYQILFIQKMITCASRVRFLRDTNCLAVHVLKWKLWTSSKMNWELSVIIQKMRICLKVWNRNCGFGIFKTGANMTSTIFCFNQWKKVSKKIRENRKALSKSFVPMQQTNLSNAHFRAWNSIISSRHLLEGKELALILRQRLKPALLQMLRTSRILQRIKRAIRNSHQESFFAWKKIPIRRRKLNFFVDKRNLYFTKRMFLLFRLCCKETGKFRVAELMLRELVMKVKCAAKRTEKKPACQASESYIDVAHTHLAMHICFGKWRDAIQDNHKASFLEIMFRCGELCVIRRFFGLWKRLRQ